MIQLPSTLQASGPELNENKTKKKQNRGCKCNGADETRETVPGSKAPAGNLLRLNTLRGIRTDLLTPRVQRAPRVFYMGVHPRGVVECLRETYCVASRAERLNFTKDEIRSQQ